MQAMSEVIVIDDDDDVEYVHGNPHANLHLVTLSSTLLWSQAMILLLIQVAGNAGGLNKHGTWLLQIRWKHLLEMLDCLGADDLEEADEDAQRLRRRTGEQWQKTPADEAGCSNNKRRKFD